MHATPAWVDQRRPEPWGTLCRRRFGTHAVSARPRSRCAARCGVGAPKTCRGQSSRVGMATYFCLSGSTCPWLDGQGFPSSRSCRQPPGSSPRSRNTRRWSSGRQRCDACASTRRSRLGLVEAVDRCRSWVHYSNSQWTSAPLKDSCRSYPKAAANGAEVCTHGAWRWATLLPWQSIPSLSGVCALAVGRNRRPSKS